MNTKLILSFIGGASIGALVCFALLKEQYEEQLDEEISAMRKFYEQEKEEMEEDHMEELRGLVNELDSEERQMDKYVDYVKKYSSPQEMVDATIGGHGGGASGVGGGGNAYLEMADKTKDEPSTISDGNGNIVATLYEHDDDEDIYNEDDDYHEAMETEDEEEDYNELDLPNPAEPYVISRIAYDNENLHYDKIDLIFYDGDGTLADDQEEVIPDIEAVVGFDNLSRFGEESENPNIVLVRNERLGSDYEVYLNPNSYAEEVLGIVDKPRRGR